MERRPLPLGRVGLVLGMPLTSGLIRLLRVLRTEAWLRVYSPWPWTLPPSQHRPHSCRPASLFRIFRLHFGHPGHSIQSGYSTEENKLFIVIGVRNVHLGPWESVDFVLVDRRGSSDASSSASFGSFGHSLSIIIFTPCEAFNACEGAC